MLSTLLLIIIYPVVILSALSTKHLRNYQILDAAEIFFNGYSISTDNKIISPDLHSSRLSFGLSSFVPPNFKTLNTFLGQNRHQNLEIQFDLTLFERKYTLRLWQSAHMNSLFTSDFAAYSVNSKGERTLLELDLHNAIFQGRVLNYPSSRITAHIEDGTKIFARIDLFGPLADDNDVLYIEPAWRYLDEPPSNSSLIAYRQSDVIEDRANPIGYLGGVVANSETQSNLVNAKGLDYNASFTPLGGQAPNFHLRRKRLAIKDASLDPNKNKCGVFLVADYLFCQNLGNGSESRTALFLIGIMNRVNTLYKMTKFSDQLNNYGFSISGIEIYCSPTPDEPDSPERNFNSKRDTSQWTAEDFLYSFSNNPDWQHYCLAHLFTYRQWVSGQLGLGFIASPDLYSVGGVCSTYTYKNNIARYVNVAWSSYQDSGGNRMTSKQSDLVTAHELGHNWGSEHDPDTAECMPTAAQGGTYIMYPYSSTGYEHNNLIFSPCSLRNIARVLSSKAPVCFEQETKAMCGNGVVDEGEQCDAGIPYSRESDPCCDKNCKLKPPAVCSYLNDPCCTSNCLIASVTTICRPAVEGHCTESVYCNGTSKDCPQISTQKPDKTPCAFDGMCFRGECKPYCEAHQFGQSCLCREPLNYCRRCCYAPGQAQNACVPSMDYTAGTPLYLPAGLPCVLGYCDRNHTCVQTKQQLAQRIWSFLGTLTASRFWTFIRNNVVGCTVIISLFIWIPIALIIEFYVDRPARQRQEQEMASYENKSMAALFRNLHPHVGEDPEEPEEIEESPPLSSPPFSASSPAEEKTVLDSGARFAPAPSRGPSAPYPLKDTMPLPMTSLHPQSVFYSRP